LKGSLELGTKKFSVQRLELEALQEVKISLEAERNKIQSENLVLTKEVNESKQELQKETEQKRDLQVVTLCKSKKNRTC
jgi:Skp family chaperone for outer membrane proteins